MEREKYEMVENYDDNRIMTAMSGGVDSSAAAFLLKEQGCSVGGMTMRLLEGGLNDGDIGDAAEVAAALGIPFFVADLREAFQEAVIEDFISSYMAGSTPNPCVVCNRRIKFSAFMEAAEEYGYRRMATGHYAQIVYDAGSGRWLLKKARDPGKDQSYMLYGLSQEQLSRSLFPLGDMTKGEVRALAEARGITTAHKRESQDICFVPDGDYAGFIERATGRSFERGDFVDADGNVLGEHLGLARYTVGQRRGLRISAGKPIFVYEKDAEKNLVRVGDESLLFRKTMEIRNINLIACRQLKGKVRADVKIRYSHGASPAVAEQIGEDAIRVEFLNEQRAITRGQSAVLYDGEFVIGGGIIV